MIGLKAREVVSDTQPTYGMFPSYLPDRCYICADEIWRCNGQALDIISLKAFSHAISVSSKSMNFPGLRPKADLRFV